MPEIVRLSAGVVFRFTASTFVDAARDLGDSSCLIGHAGGGDFRVVIDPSSAHDLCRTVVARFDDGILDLYDREDALRGYVEIQGPKQHHAFPIISISIGIAANSEGRFSSESDAATVAAEMMERAKSLPGSAFVPSHGR